VPVDKVKAGLDSRWIGEVKPLIEHTL
jgi:hypothetical protein